MDNILVLDFGSQYTQLIAKNIRKDGIYCEIMPYNTSIKIIQKLKPNGIILSGGPASIYNKNAYMPHKEIWNLNIPILGICYGLQIIVNKFGGKVGAAKKHEYGKANLEITKQGKNSKLLSDIQNNQIVWMSHGDKTIRTPEGFEVIAQSKNAKLCAFENKTKNIYAMQFHPEVVHSVCGFDILNNFTNKICKCKKQWNMKRFSKLEKENITKLVKKNKVLCGVSGGVDSSVVACMLNSYIGKQLICVFIDNGLLRYGEVKEVQKMFRKQKISLVTINAKKIFLKKLKNITDPEKKRKIIGKTFIQVFDNYTKNEKFSLLNENEKIKFLAQGTLYTDIIESVSIKGPSKTIKSHHNVGGLPKKMNLKLIEPLKEIFKDEVRELGLELGIKKNYINRHPFPGPGLGIRIIGNITKSKLDILRQADKILITSLKKQNYYLKTWQAFCVLLNVKSVGVMGDNRTYQNTICVRCVDAIDGMTATFSRLPYELLDNISAKIINEVDGVNRVVYDISSKPPATIEWE
jgi:GMP synthase (glutamine-hydrolysing)